jgi:hypothetical protein
MRKSIIEIILFGVLGVTLAHYGITIITWGFWVITTIIFLISLNREIK